MLLKLISFCLYRLSSIIATEKIKMMFSKQVMRLLPLFVVMNWAYPTMAWIGGSTGSNEMKSIKKMMVDENSMENRRGFLQTIATSMIVMEGVTNSLGVPVAMADVKVGGKIV